MPSLKTIASAATASALLVLTMPAAPAMAYGETTASATTVVTGDGCVDHPVTYSINLPAGSTDFSMRIKFKTPSGADGVGMTIATSLGHAPSGTLPHQICSHEGIGTWTMYPEMTTYKDAAGKTQYGPLPGTPSSFEVVGKAKTTVKLSAKKKGKKVKAKATLTMTAGGDAQAVANQKVIFQVKKGRKFKKVDAATTDASGVAKATFKSRGKTTVRAIFKGAGEVVVGNVGLPLPPAKSRTKTVR